MNSTLIYDGNCPLCGLYTKAFVKSGLLNGKGRISFEEVKDDELIKLVDWNRARNEIPLVDREKRKVFYGVDALLNLLGSRFSFFRYFAGIKPLVDLSKHLYSFISFNRRVIIPSAQNCHAPDFNLKYRIAYLLFTVFFTGLILSVYTEKMQSLTGPSGYGREFMICGGQIIFQLLFLLMMRKNPQETFEYLGNMMTISFSGAILLLPMQVAGSIFNPPAELFAFYFLLVAALMFAEHYRRMKLLQLPSLLTLSWVIYRLLILALILYINQYTI